MNVEHTAKAKDEFLDKFSQLNSKIEIALGSQDFERAMKIDQARRTMLHEFTKQTMPDGDKPFFDTLEKCAADNAKAITQITSEMKRIQQASSQKIRLLDKYRKGNA